MVCLSVRKIVYSLKFVDYHLKQADKVLLLNPTSHNRSVQTVIDSLSYIPANQYFVTCITYIVRYVLLNSVACVHV